MAVIQTLGSVFIMLIIKKKKACTMFLSSHRNTSECLGEREMRGNLSSLWQFVMNDHFIKTRFQITRCADLLWAISSTAYVISYPQLMY